MHRNFNCIFLSTIEEKSVSLFTANPRSNEDLHLWAKTELKTKFISKASLTQMRDHRIEYYIYETFYSLLGNDIRKQIDNRLWSPTRIWRILNLSLWLVLWWWYDIVHHRTDSWPGNTCTGDQYGTSGFLAGIDKKLINDAVYQLVNGMFSIEDRSMLKLDSNPSLFVKFRWP